MKHYVQSLSFAILLSLFTSPAGAQIHGLAIDLGKTHKEDTTHVTNFSIGVNSSTDTLKGVQLNMLSNYAHNVQGLQLAGFTNISSSPLRGAQLSAVTNISMGVQRGLQASGLLNVSSGRMSGMQVAA